MKLAAMEIRDPTFANEAEPVPGMILRRLETLADAGEAGELIQTDYKQVMLAKIFVCGDKIDMASENRLGRIGRHHGASSKKEGASSSGPLFRFSAPASRSRPASGSHHCSSRPGRAEP